MLNRLVIHPTIMIATFLVILGCSSGDVTGKEGNMNSESSESSDKITCEESGLYRSFAMVNAIIDDLSKNYDHIGGGGISEIKQLATYSYRVSIDQEERIDQITYEFEISKSCQVNILKREVTAATPWNNK